LLQLADLWGRLARFPASNLDGPLQLIQTVVGRLVGAPQGHVVVAKRLPELDARRDPLEGWRPIHALAYGDRSGALKAAADEYLKRPENHLDDPLTRRSMRTAGTA